MQNDRPHRIKSPLKFGVTQWWSVVKRTFKGIQTHNISLISAGVAFYFLLAIFPLLSGLVSLYGLMIEPEDIQRHIDTLIAVFPTQSQSVFEQQMESLIKKSTQTLSTGFILSLVLTIWSGGKGAKAMITATNISYRETKSRGFIRAAVAKIVLTLAIIISIIVTLGLMTFVPEFLSFVSGFDISEDVATWLSWPLLLIVFNVGLASLYRYTPNRSSPKWRWVTPGSLIATMSWLLASLAFSYYLDNYASYSQTYGSIGGIVILLMWFYLTAFIILVGAEFNAACELETHSDSTVGQDQPLGERGADVADSVD